MLKRIKIDNFGTFIEPTVVDFTATNYKFLGTENIGKNKILKGCLFVGENASGKTMILKSIKTLLDLLFNDKDFPFLRYKSFFREDKNCSLEYIFVINNKKINYAFSFDDDSIVSERLIYDGKELLNRLGTTAKIAFNDNKVFKDIAPNRLFLRRVYFDTNFYDDKTLIKWFNFLANSVYINCFQQEAFSYTGKDLSIHTIENECFKDRINKFLKEINYGQEIDLKRIDGHNMVMFKRKGIKGDIPEYLESTGNVVLTEIMPTFIHSLEKDCMIIYDEFSSGLHNELEECIIKYFFHYAKNSQLFFTSHSTNLLNNTILRPDQVFSVSFNAKRGAYLKRFSEEMPRESQNLEKMYLSGVFNGVPRYNKIFKD